MRARIKRQTKSVDFQYIIKVKLQSDGEKYYVPVVQSSVLKKPLGT